MSILEAISHAESLLTIQSVATGPDPRWQAIIEVGEHINESPQEVWHFIRRARVDADEDLEVALTTVLLEHLVERHEEFRRKARDLAETDIQMKRMLESCW